MPVIIDTSVIVAAALTTERYHEQCVELFDKFRAKNERMFPRIVVFDFGNVLVRWDPKFGFPKRSQEEIDRFFSEFDFHDFNHYQDAGRSLSDGIAATQATQPEWVPWLTEYLEGYPNTLRGPVQGMYSIVRELKDNGVPIYGLTNWWEELYHFAEDSTPAIRLMDGVVVSGIEKVAKPEPKIFHLISERYGFQPEAAVFIDDSPKNVAGAEAVGFTGIHFQNAAKLRQQLHDLGFPIQRTSTIEAE